MHLRYFATSQKIKINMGICTKAVPTEGCSVKYLWHFCAIMSTFAVHTVWIFVTHTKWCIVYDVPYLSICTIEFQWVRSFLKPYSYWGHDVKMCKYTRNSSNFPVLCIATSLKPALSRFSIHFIFKLFKNKIYNCWVHVDAWKQIQKLLPITIRYLKL